MRKMRKLKSKSNELASTDVAIIQAKTINSKFCNDPNSPRSRDQ